MSESENTYLDNLADRNCFAVFHKDDVTETPLRLVLLLKHLLHRSHLALPLCKGHSKVKIGWKLLKTVSIGDNYLIIKSQKITHNG